MLFLDTETTSPVNIKLAGARRYLQEARLLCVAWARDNGPVNLWIRGQATLALRQALTRAELEGEEVLTFNADFDEGALRLEFPHALNWVCAAKWARGVGLPGSLAHCAQVMGLPGKDKEGAALMKKSQNMREVPQDMAERIGKYCMQDVEVLRDVHAFLTATPLTPFDKESIAQDYVMNARGLPVDLGAATTALTILRGQSAPVAERFTQLTGLTLNQTVAACQWAKARGYPLDTLAAVDVEDWLSKGEGTPELREALQARLDAASVAEGKLVRLLDMQVGGRLYGTFLWSGAITGRWAGRGYQPQNLPHGGDDTAAGLSLLRSGTVEGWDMLFDQPVQTVARCLRGLIYRKEGFFSADFSAIEARLVAWLAGQEGLLEQFRQVDAGDKDAEPYRVLAARALGIASHDVTKDQRAFGKRGVLGAGYGIGAGGMHRQLVQYAKMGLLKEEYASEQLAALLVQTYRSHNPNVVRLWYACEEAVKRAMAGQAVRVGKVSFHQCREGVRAQLPCDSSIYFRFLRMEQDGRLTYLTLNEKTSVPQRTDLYGGKIVGTLTQGLAGRLMREALIRLEKAGYETVGTIHDQAIVNARGTLEEFLNLYTQKPLWLTDFPLAAEGYASQYYK